MSARVRVSAPAALPQTLAAIARTAAQLCEANDAMIFQVDGDSFLVVAKHGRVPTTRRLGQTFPLDRDTVYGRAVLERRTIHIPDIAVTARTTFPALQRRQRATGVRTMLVTPLLRGGRAIGMIAIRRIRVQPFTTRQVALLKTFAGQAALAIENAHLLGELGARNRELEARDRDLTEALEQQTATSEILRVISLRAVLATLIENATRLCGAEKGFIFRQEDGLYHLAVDHGASPEFVAYMQSRPIAPGRGTLVGRTALEGRTVHIPDVLADAEYRGATRLSGIRTMLGVPMLRESAAVGVIAMWKERVEPFTDSQIALVTTFANQAVIAIENARLVNELEARNRRLSEALDQQTATAEILRVISSSPTDLQPFFDAVAESAARLCQAQDTGVHLVDGTVLRLAAHHGPIPAGEVGEFTMPLVRGTINGRAVIERRIVQVADLQNEPEEFPEGAAIARHQGHRTALAVPLLREGGAIGTIYARRNEVRLFSEPQIALLQTFADQAVIAIENVRLFKELEARNRELTDALEQQTATADILRTISTSPTDLQPVLDSVVQSAARLCGGYDANLFRVDGDLLRNAAHHGPLSAPADLVLAFRGTVVGRSVLERRAVQVADVQAEADEFPEGSAKGLELGHRTVLSVPLLSEGVALGAISVRRAEAEPFTDKQIALLRTFADQAVIAIENVRLFKELEARNRDLSAALDRQTATAEILRAISQAHTDIQPVFEAIADSAMRLFGAWSALVFRYDGEFIRLAAARGGLPGSNESVMERRQAPRRPEEDDPAGRTVMTRAVQHVVDVGLDLSWGPEFREGARVRGFRSVVSVPMLRGGDAVGVITVSRGQVGGFTPAEIALLQTFADQAVIAVENARLLTELQARNADLTEALGRQTATAEILRVIGTSPTEAQPVFEGIARSGVRVCGALGCVVFVVDGDMLRVAATHGVRPERVERFRSQFPVPLTAGDDAARVVRERSIFHLADIGQNPEASPEQVEFARLGGYRTRLMVPIVRGDSALGLIAVTREAPTPFSDRQVDLLQTFADQAVIAIENVRLFKELEARNRDLADALEQQTATSEILRAISSSPTDVQPVFQAIAENAVRLSGALFGSVYRFDGELIHMVSHHNYPPAALEFSRRSFPTRPSRQVFTGRAIIERAVVHVPDVSQDRERLLAQDLAEVVGFRSALSVPMLREDSPIGAITVFRDSVGPFSDKHVALLQIFADQAVIAIENVRLFSELRERTTQLTRSVEQLTALGEVGRAVSSTLDLETLLDTIVARAVQLSGTSGGLIYEYEESSQEFHLRATYRMEDELVAALRAAPVRLGEGATGRAAALRAPVQVPDIPADQEYSVARLRPLLDRLGYRSLLSMPLLFEQRIMGALVVWRREAGRFTPEVVNLLQTFASQSCLAINNARLFREIEAKGRQLEIASQHKSHFLANMSHELRTPLNAILGYSELMADGTYGEVPERMGEVLERVDRSGRHLLGLINDILDLSKIEAGQLKLMPVDYSLEDVVRSVAASAEPLAAAKQLALAVTVAPDLPLGWGDARRLTQVLLNLVGNAIKFTDSGQVAVQARAAGDAFVVAVADTGPGIAENERERIFEEFQQAETTTRSAKGGTGLGLAIARRIIEMHGGRLWLESTLGRGSTFTFTVPVRMAEPAATARGAG